MKKVATTQTRKRKALSTQTGKQKRTHEAELIWSTIGKTLVSSQELDSVLTHVIQIISQRMKVESGSVFLRDSATDEIVFAKILHGDVEKFASVRLKVGQGVVGWVVQTGRSTIVNSAAKDPRWYRKVDKATGFTTQTILCVPLIAQGEVIGAIELLNKLGGEFTSRDQELLESIAGPIAIAVQNARLFEQVREGRERLKHLASQLIDAQEDERRMISLELHDDIGQALTAVNLNLLAIERSTRDPAVKAGLNETLKTIDETLTRLRDISVGLHPSALDDLGLVVALEMYFDRVARHAKLEVHIHAHPPTMELPSDVKNTAFRVIQESFTNIVRHAHAKEVTIELTEHPENKSTSDSLPELEILVQDDGVGFEVPVMRARASRGESLGLLSMQERVLLLGGQFEINSQPGAGTQVCARLPLPSADSPSRWLERRMPTRRKNETDSRSLSG